MFTEAAGSLTLRPSARLAGPGDGSSGVGGFVAL